MSRKRTPDHTSTETSTPGTTAAIAEPPEAEVKAEGRSFAERVGQRKSAITPDPFGIAKDNLAGVHFFESKDDRQMALKFDEKPSQAVINKVKEAGYHWQPANKVWAHPVKSDSAMSTRIDAERLYQEVRHMIREEKGIPAGREVPF